MFSHDFYIMYDIMYVYLSCADERWKQIQYHNHNFVFVCHID